jgi:hypothetical protein
MITRVGMAPRRSGTSFSEFQQHWLGAHAEAALQIPNLRAYTQNHAVLDSAGRPLLPYPGFDACAETDYDNLASMEAGFASAAYRTRVRADEDLLIEKAKFFLLLCERVELNPGDPPPGAVKLMTFMRAHPLADRHRLLDLAAGPYAVLVGAAGALRHEQLIPVPEAHACGQPPNCELVDSVWFATTEQALAFVNGAAAVEADELLAGMVFGRERLLAIAHVILAR